MNPNIHLAITAGELLLVNGAEIFRVEQTIAMIARQMGAEKVDSFITPTGMMTSIAVDSDTNTYVRSIRSRGYDLTTVVEINDLSRRFCAGEIQIEELAKRLSDLTNAEVRSSFDIRMALASGFGALGFAYILGLRNPLALLYATINGFVVRAVLDIIETYTKVPGALAVLVSSFMLTALTFLYPDLSVSDQNLVALGGLILLLPGVALSTSFRELANGELLSGISRLAEALITLTMVAAGVISCYTFLPLLQEVLML